MTKDLGIKMTSKEGAVWEGTRKNMEIDMRQARVELEINRHILKLVKKKCKEHNIDLGEE